MKARKDKNNNIKIPIILAYGSLSYQNKLQNDLELYLVRIFIELRTVTLLLHGGNDSII